MKTTSTLFLVCASALAVALSSCTPVQRPGLAAGGIGEQPRYLAGIRNTTPYDGSATNPNEAASFWDGDGVTGSPKIEINLNEQQAYFYKGDQLVGLAPVSTGTEARATPRGSFKVTEKSPDHKSSLYGVIRNVATGEIVNDDADTRKHFAGPGEVFERAPMPNFLRFNGGVGMHTGFLPGYAASHGCVRMPDKMAKHFYQNAPLGTPVIVK
jgi:hypothetical protein